LTILQLIIFLFRGSFLANSINKKFIQDYNVEGLTRLLGVGLNSFKEFNKENIDCLNLLCMNSNKSKVNHEISQIKLQKK